MAKLLTGIFGYVTVVSIKIFMDESKKHLYRLDPVKLQQKIYDLYPTNSAIRKRMIADIKKEQLSYYTKLLQDFPVKLAEKSLAGNTSAMIKFGVAGVICGLLGLGGILSGFFFPLTILERILLSMLGGLSLGVATAQFKILFDLKATSDNFKKSVSGIQQKIDDLRKGL